MRPDLSPLVEGLRELCPNTAAVDFETYYSKDCSVQTDGNWAYCQNPEWDAYMVSIYAPGIDLEYVGPPRDAPWEKISGMTWLAHNANFDRHVYERLVEQGLIPEVAYKVWHDTADLAVYSHLPRALASAVKTSFDLSISKAARSNAKGKRWPLDFSETEQHVMLDYAMDDAVLCMALWGKHAGGWPQHERDLSLHTGNIEFRGVPVSREQIEKNLEILQTALWAAKKKIPWHDETDQKCKPVALGSPKAMERECFRRGVPPPKTTALKEKAFIDWLDDYGELVPSIRDLSRYRRINRAIKVYQSLLKRIRPDGMASLSLKYFGADKTGRWSGTSKFNLQNMAKAPIYLDKDFGWLDTGVFGAAPDGAVYVVDMRSCIVALPGHTLGISDLSQIEPRMLSWVIQDRVFLAACAAGQSPYEAHARASMGWTGGVLKKENPDIYALAKARVLALGYGAGWQKFIEMARGYLGSEEAFLEIFAKDTDEDQRAGFINYNEWLTDKLNNKAAKTVLREWPMVDDQTKDIWVNAWIQVTDFRKSNPLLASKKLDGPLGIWEKLDAAFKKAADTSGFYETAMPSGRSLHYYDVTSSRGYQCRQNNPNAVPTRMYGGKLTENLIQALSRDAFALGILRLEQAGLKVLFTVHDEAVVDLPPGRSIDEVNTLLAQPPPWAKSLPVAAEGESSVFYQK